MTSSRCILSVFDNYQKAKINFLQNIYDYTLKKEINVDQLLDLEVMHQVTPLLGDVPNVQNLALVTTVRLCSCSEKIANYILKKKVLTRLACEFESQPKEFRRNVLNIMKNISKYPDLTNDLFSQGHNLLNKSMYELDTCQRELVLTALTNIANSSYCNAKHVMELNLLPQIILCLQCPVNLSLEATQLIKALSKQSLDMANIVIENDVLTHLADNLNNGDIKLIKQTMLSLIEIAKHNQGFAEKVMSTRVLCKTILYTSHCDISVRKTAATLIRELSKHSADLSKSIVQHGALAGLINMIANTNSLVRLPAVMALGYMGSQSDELALAIIHSQGLQELIKALNNETHEDCLGALVWSIEQATKHSARHVTYLNDTNVFAKFLRIYLSPESSPDLKTRCLSALLNTVSKCLNIQDMDLLLYGSPPELLLPTIRQLSKIFAIDLKARRVFVSTGGLKRVLALKAVPGTELCEAITILNSYFPEDIVRYFSSHISDTLLAKMDEYVPDQKCPEPMYCTVPSPQSLSMLSNEQMSECVASLESFVSH